MDSMGKSLASQTKRTEELQSQVQLSQDRVAEATAAAAAAEVDLKSAEQKVAELAESLDSAKLNHGQAVEELQQQHTDQTQVGLGFADHAASYQCQSHALPSCTPVMQCPVL